MARAPKTTQTAPPHPLVAHLQGRIEGLTSAVLVFPLFLVYQLGILSGRGQNGVDFVTQALIRVSHRDLSQYLVILAGLLVAYAAVVVLLRRRGQLAPRAFVPMLVESTFYALIMGSIIVFVIRQFAGIVPGLVVGGAGPLDVVVISAGAGFHEELIFRVILMGGLAWLLTGLTGARRAWLLALVLSSLAFSLAHHIGPVGEPFTFAAFVYRTLAGVFFALVYQIRGFAVAAWTHALYDVYVLSLTA
ncbi:CPBP family glutamic-type intramembrane protease [Paraliomyxa miuraensis]|uniref:CPBP family glutamic-type intramembrane protease n=1 Tax=Paraliomyxa miuraensis TaxID=376150 RepID=UPI00224D6116|nr:CPBP family glutamic-type intramembrane protease [Paraliomyxa miuraensis]MCX4243227.1 CPBP family glutamic-type intramembrane protease [Paraliomyxa miuraensis]